MMYVIINDEGKILEVVNREKVFRDIATYPKKEIKQLLRDQQQFIDVCDSLENLAATGYLKKYGKHSKQDDEVYLAVKATVVALTNILNGKSFDAKP